MCPDDIITGVETQLWVSDPELCEGIPTKAAWEAEYVSGGIVPDIQRAYSRALRNRPTMRRKVVAGKAFFEGQIVLEVTPEGPFPRFAAATLPFATTTLAGPTRYRHRFSNQFGAKAVTLIQRKGAFFFVYPGAKVSNLEFSFDFEQEGVLVATFTVMALDQIVFPVATVPTAPTLLGTATAPVDPLLPYHPWMCSMTIAGLVAGIKTASWTIAKNLGRDGVLRGKRGARSHFERLAETSGRASLNFQGDANIQRDFGVTNPAGAYAIGDTIATAAVAATFTPPVNGSGFANLFTLAWPNADIKATQTISGADEVPEELTFFPVDAVGDAADTDFYFEITNSEDNASLSAAGTPVTSVPVSKVTTYEYGIVGAAPAPTDTVFASDSTHLSATDDAYTGRTLKFLTGANAGTSKTISDYVGASRTFTVGSAFAGAPSAGDVFDIV